MPNTGRITVCPFYLSDKNRTISCEDVFHRYDTQEEKKEWMDRYCDNNWESCPYAQDLNRVYESGDLKEHKILVLEKEARKLSQKLTRAEKKAEALEEELRTERKRKQNFEAKAAEVVKKLMNLRKEKEDLERRLLETAHMYEARFCYLMDEFSDGGFNEAEFWAWTKNKEYRLKGMDPDEDGRPTWWKAEIKKGTPENVLSDKDRE